VTCESASSVVISRRSDSLADRTSLSFRERMTGFYVHGTRSPGGEAYPGARERVTFRLTITIDDVSRFLADREHLARAEGWIDADRDGGRRPIQRGWFNLFAPAGAPDRRMMRYRLHYTDALDRPRTLAGWKNIRPGPVSDIWPDTTTVYFQVFDGHVTEDDDERSTVVGAGILRIRLGDFLRQLTTFRTRGPGGPAALLRFARFFFGDLWRVYRPRPHRS
jgi:cholesterol oxidase